MLLDVIFLSFLVALLRGGRVKEIPTFNKMSLLVISLCLQICSAIFHEYGGVFISIAYVFIIAFLFCNWEYEDVRIFKVGWLLNALAIWTNRGKMPIDMEQAKRLPYDLSSVIEGTNYKHSVLTADSNLPFLTDIIYMPSLIPRVISIGDIFIMLGAFLLVQRIMNKPISLIQLREGKSYATKN